MEVYRLTRSIFSQNLDGKGSAITGGRWNSVGIEAIYVASSRALAILEVLVHLPAGMIPDEYKLMVIYIPDPISMEKVNFDDLPNGWHTYPIKIETKLIGDSFIKKLRCSITRVLFVTYKKPTL